MQVPISPYIRFSSKVSSKVGKKENKFRRSLLETWTITRHGEERGCKLTFGQADRSGDQDGSRTWREILFTGSDRDAKEKGKNWERERESGGSLSNVLRITFRGQIEFSFFSYVAARESRFTSSDKLLHITLVGQIP